MKYSACATLILGEGGKVWEAQVKVPLDENGNTEWENPASCVSFIQVASSSYQNAKKAFWEQVKVELPDTYLHITKTLKGN